MDAVRHVDDGDVKEAVEKAVAVACESLDSSFPGRDAGGITSNFQGLLEQVVMQMLIGRSQLDGARGHSVALPQLVIDDAFFGSPLLRGDLFLPVKTGEGGEPSVVALDPDGGGFKSLGAVGDAWTSFEAAAKAARKVLDHWLADGMSLQDASDKGLRVIAVKNIPNAERGFVAAHGDV